ncbi:insulinase family protein [Halovulum dunhuangense]|uniref:Insulinase family protein n=1 Tax=Halovulum dunhuangense TaxID=1505036 RepID=A0A849KVA3_9RHOB|nr:pitrilysin family protein [Halovulum dunhuangense]NNU79581.1 insulinase family protein [Halovulum dunhuangense]
MRLFRAVLILCLAPLAVLASTRDDVTSFTLDNGLEVVVIEDHRAAVVTHMLWYRVGSADEPPGKSGIAHFLEHLMFKGTENMDSGEFSRVVAENGGSGNAFTSWDYTGYFQRVAADRLGLMMQMEADRMRGLRLTPEEVETERGVILEERNLRVENDPLGIYSEQSRAAFYLNHPYGRPIIGWRHEIEALTREDALAFYRTYYAPNNAVLIVAGDVQPDAVRALAEEHYGPIEPTPDLPPRIRPAEPPQLAERRIVYRDARVSQPSVSRSYLAPVREAGDQERAAALAVLADLLGGGITSHLSRVLELEERVAIRTGASYSATALDPQGFTLFAVPAEGVSLDELEMRIDAAIARFLEEGPDPEDLERVKAGIRASEIYSLDSLQGRASTYGAALASGLTVADVQAWLPLLAEVEAEDVMEAARDVFDRRRSVTGHVMGAEG